MTTARGETPGAGGESFATTRWTVVLATQGADTAVARVALEDLCRGYWRPLYAFVRRLGHAPHDAQDLTQGFFAHLLSGNALATVSPDRGRFRSFLRAALKHFLANEWDRARALKRGGGVGIVSLEALEAEEESIGGPGAAGEASAAEKAYDRQWAMTVLNRVLDRLEAEFRAAGKYTLYEALRETLVSDRASAPYAELGRRVGLSEGAVKVAVYRLRQRYRELLLEEIGATVGRPEDVAAELQELFVALGS